MLKGIATSSGIAIGKVYKLEQPKIVLSENKQTKEEALDVFNKALEKTIKDIEQIKERASATLKEEELAIFDAHLMMVQDPEFIDQIKAKIEEGENADKATKEVSDFMIGMFESMDDAYFKERAADIKDVSFRLLCNILGLNIPDLTAIDEEVVIVAEEMTPSDTAQLNKKYALGFVTEIGGKTSHAAIMAVALGLPAVVGCTGIMGACKHGDTIILDAKQGDVIVNPTADELKLYEEKRAKFLEEKAALQVLLDKPTISTDGHQVELVANIGSPKDMDNVIANGAEGVGLYRTEFLYMESTEDFPSEDDQFEAYKVVLERAKGKRVVVRTLDIGGDKKLPYFEFDPEMNPFLGYRAIRLCLDRRDIFKTQVRALLRASTYGKLAIMFPMIATIDEFKDAKQFVLDTKEELIKEGVKVSDSIEIGMMVEIPASAVLADEFAKYADFFSAINVLPDLKGNGRLTLGENLADHGGLQVAWEAYKNATKRAPLGEKDGLTADQRFFHAYAGVWAGNITEAEIRNRTKSDPHSLGRWRVNGALPHIDAWYEAFGVKEGDKMYIPKAERLQLW